MEPRRKEPMTTKPRPEKKLKRFRLLKLEERIAPGGNHYGNSNNPKLCSGDGGGYSGLASIE
jgi:hypothetical protein